MSLHYIIDGYNIINHPLFVKQTTKESEDARIKLLEFIKRNQLCGSPNNTITVVFDGYFDASGLKAELSGINVISSKDETADQAINRFVQQSNNPKNVVVVSDDREIKLFTTALGAKVISVEDFISQKAKHNKFKEQLLKPELTYSQVCKINQELKKIWLKE